ncbi:hypothetical protein DKG77_03105 [Flagellimonas aquimarina]|uniref:Uncharacterized protein n=1 Tax=Flagellimonas aquimarina TaxID=2201895 RepID=A0A316L1X9_9FLAO|nr:hypothetical protein DKG77_03105 [Allomuricauda koreensis]
MKLVTILFAFLWFCSCKQSNKVVKEETIDNDTTTIGWRISSKEDWLRKEGLMNVESVVLDKANKVMYASNGKKYRTGSDGFISKISENGELLELHWISELNRPTGMAIKDSILYVADVDRLVKININSTKMVGTFQEPIENSGLNDVGITEKGEVFVTGSFVHSVFKLKDDKLELWAHDEEKLAWANGLIAHEEGLTVAGLHIKTIDYGTGAILPFELGSTMKDFDGLTEDGTGGFFVTTVENSGLYYINNQKEVTQLIGEEAYCGDLAFDSSSNTLYVPRGSVNKNEFFITVLNLEKHSQK